MKDLKIVELPKEVMEKAQIIGNVFDELNELNLAITHIENLVGDDFCEDMEWKEYKSRPITQDEALHMVEKLRAIYRTAHSVQNSHSCYGVHENWREEYRNTPKEKESK